MSRSIACLIALSSTASLVIGCQQQHERSSEETIAEPSQMTPVLQYEEVVVEASCGQCQLGMPGSGCDLAVRIDETAYYVEGTGIDDHGDAHAADGLCNAVRRARVSGEVVDGRFVATELELLPDDGE